MQKRFFWSNGLFVVTAFLLTAGGTLLTKPNDPKTSLVNGGVVGLSAGGIMLWVDRRNKQANLTLRQDLKEYLQYTIKTTRELSLSDLKQELQQLKQQINQAGSDQVGLKEQLSHINLTIQRTQDSIKRIEDRLAPIEAAIQQPPGQVGGVKNSFETVSNHPLAGNGLTTPRPRKRSRVIEEFTSKQTDTVNQWFQQHQMIVDTPPPPVQPINHHYNELALYLGDHYIVLKPLLAYMKRALHKGNQPNSFWLDDSQGMSEADFRICTNFCEKLKQAFLVEGDFYPRSGRRFLKGKLADDPNLRSFLDGRWFERFVYQKMAQILMERGLDYACLLNARILSPSTRRAEAELDMFFLVEGQPICIECKSGQYQQEDARKFSRYAERLGLENSQAIFVVPPDYDADVELQQSQMRTITMTTSANLVTALEGALQAVEAFLVETGEELAVETRSGSDTLNPALQQLKGKYRPILPQRSRVWQHLINLSGSDHSSAPLSFVSLKSLLADRLDLSKNQLNGVLLLLRNNGFFVDAEANPVIRVSQPIVSLRSQSPTDIEAVFVEEYVKLILRLDWNFFNDTLNRQQFEAIVGAPSPTAATVEKLKQELSDNEDDFK